MSTDLERNKMAHSICKHYGTTTDAEKTDYAKCYEMSMKAQGQTYPGGRRRKSRKNKGTKKTKKTKKCKGGRRHRKSQRRSRR